MKLNDIDMNHWKDSDINTDSLWMISQRDKSGKHKNIYHGNFVPQVPYQLLQRYTKKGEVIFKYLFCDNFIKKRYNLYKRGQKC